MQGTAQKAQPKPPPFQPGTRLKLRLNAPSFGKLIKAFVGDKKEYEIGELFGYDDSKWAQYKTGNLFVNTHIIAVCLSLFPGVPVSAYADPVATVRKSSNA